nr:MAG TPA: hypothetical protein [Caudoviricetes sp.]
MRRKFVSVAKLINIIRPRQVTKRSYFYLKERTVT